MGSGAHVLLLTASDDESEMYAVYLESCGYRVTVAQNAASARRIARSGSVQVLVIDALFGAGSPRTELTGRWSNLAQRSQLPIVVLSGYLPGAKQPSRTDQLGVFKPCLPDQLSSHIERLLSAPVANRPEADGRKG
jgi:DNA-binding response OmpR family regulator